MTNKPKSMDRIPVDVLLGAYSNGYFPMSKPGRETVDWYYSDPATVIPLDRFVVPRSLKQFIRKCSWLVSTDSAFADVIRACAKRRETWISGTIIRSYTQLHEEGYAHSVEISDERRLIGGLYGVSIGGAFFGESMFHVRPNASKTALAVLLRMLQHSGYRMLDIQMLTPVMEQFSAQQIHRDQYISALKEALDTEHIFPRVHRMPVRDIFDT